MLNWEKPVLFFWCSNGKMGAASWWNNVDLVGPTMESSLRIDLSNIVAIWWFSPSSWKGELEMVVNSSWGRSVGQDHSVWEIIFHPFWCPWYEWLGRAIDGFNICSSVAGIDVRSFFIGSLFFFERYIFIGSSCIKFNWVLLYETFRW